MKTVNVTAIAIILTLAFIVIACEFSTGGSTTTTSTEPELPKASLYPELAVFMEVRDAITKRVIESGANPDELAQALQDQDMDRFASLINMSPGEEAEISTRLDATVNSVHAKRPDLNSDLAPANAMCDIQFFFAEFYPELLDTTRPPITLGKKTDDACDGGANCDYDNYVMALVGCTATGPYIYWLCSYFAMCEYCHGGWIDNVC